MQTTTLVPGRVSGSVVVAKVAVIENLDFSQVKGKLMLPLPEGRGWTQEQADAAETWYKRFLTLHVLYPNHRNVPNSPIDAFWHGHILDTRKYAQDCESMFGRMFHHYPYFGLNGDATDRDRCFKETMCLYEVEFGENPALMLAEAGHGVDCCDPCSTDEG